MFTAESGGMALLFFLLHVTFLIFQILVIPFIFCSVFSALLSNSSQHVNISLKRLTVTSTWKRLSENLARFYLFSFSFVCCLPFVGLCVCPEHFPSRSPFCSNLNWVVFAFCTFRHTDISSCNSLSSHCFSDLTSFIFSEC